MSIEGTLTLLVFFEITEVVDEGAEHGLDLVLVVLYLLGDGFLAYSTTLRSKDFLAGNVTLISILHS